MKLSQYHKAFYKELFEVPIDKYWGKCIFCWVPAFLLRHFRFRLSGRISKRIRRKLNGRQMCMYTESFLRRLSATSSVFHPNMQHPKFYIFSISSSRFHLYLLILSISFLRFHPYFFILRHSNFPL